MILGLSGAAGAGKSTAADILVREHGFVRVKFAGPLKAMLRGYLTHLDCDAATIERLIEGDLKEQPTSLLSGASPRYVMQTLGTEWGREFIHPDFWINAWTAQARRIAATGRSVVADDCRFENEASAIRQAGGFVLRLKRPGAGLTETQHRSEAGVEADTTIWNDGPPEVLGWRLEGIVKRTWRDGIEAA